MNETCADKTRAEGKPFESQNAIHGSRAATEHNPTVPCDDRSGSAFHLQLVPWEQAVCRNSTSREESGGSLRPAPLGLRLVELRRTTLQARSNDCEARTACRALSRLSDASSTPREPCPPRCDRSSIEAVSAGNAIAFKQFTEHARAYVELLLECRRNKDRIAFCDG